MGKGSTNRIGTVTMKAENLKQIREHLSKGGKVKWRMGKGYLTSIKGKMAFFSDGDFFHVSKLIPSEWDLESVADNSSLPSDWAAPEWDKYWKCHNWRNHVSEEIAEIWDTFTDVQKKVLASHFQNLANREEWE